MVIDDTAAAGDAFGGEDKQDAVGAFDRFGQLDEISEVFASFVGPLRTKWRKAGQRATVDERRDIG